MSDAEKVSKVLSAKGISLHEANGLLEFGQGTLHKLITRNGKMHPLSREKFRRTFHVKTEWWETGKGDIFDENPTPASEPESVYKKKERRVPFYDTIAVGGNTMLADQSPITEPAGYVNPGDFFPKAAGVMNVYGHSCFPKYPAGCKVAFKEADKELILWGEDYVIELTERRIIKRLEKHEDKNFVKAVSYNKSDSYVYADIDIPIIKIKRLFMVLGKVELEASI